MPHEEKRCRIIPRLEPYLPGRSLASNVRRLFEYLRIMQVWCECCHNGGGSGSGFRIRGRKKQPDQAGEAGQRSQQHRMVPAENTARDSWDAGKIDLYGGPDIPIGWLECDGREVDRHTYAGLFGVIGTFYGDGDGSTTFNLPDLRGTSAIGAS